MPSLSGKDRKYLGGWIKDTRKKQEQQYGGFADRFKGYGEEAYGYGKGLRDFVTDQYKGLLSPAEGGVGGGGGGYEPDTSSLSNYESWFKNVGETGATTPEQLENLRGYGVFKDFANTGGFSDADQANYRARGLSGVPSLYEGMRRDLGNRMAVSGGYGPGFDYAGSQLARDRARSIADTNLGVETNLANMIREGRKWGASSGSGAEQNILDRQMNAMGQGSGLAQAIANQRASAAASSRAGSQEDFRNRMAILGELRGLRGETGAEMDYGQMEMGGYGGFGDSAFKGQNAFNATQQRPSFTEKLGGVVSGLGSLAGGIGGVVSGLGGLRGKPKPKLDTNQLMGSYSY